MTAEELLRHAYIESNDPLVLELCKHLARMLDENAELKTELQAKSPYARH
jgi:hypothetical protein